MILETLPRDRWRYKRDDHHADESLQISIAMYLIYLDTTSFSALKYKPKNLSYISAQNSTNIMYTKMDIS